MRAAVFHGKHDLRLEDVPEPEPGPDDLKLRVRYCGICGSDLHEVDHGPIFTPSKPHPLTGVSLPVILGHELSGEVVAVGERVEDVPLGTLVAVNPIQACGSCPACLAGATSLCPRRAAHGLSRAGGGFAEHTVIRRDMAVPIPDGVSPRSAATVEPLSVGYHAAHRAPVAAGTTAAVLGLGPIGIAVLLALHAAGVRTIASDPSERRRAAARALGCSHVLDPTADDVAQAMRELTDGRGVDAAYDAAGVPSTLETAYDGTRIGGDLVVVAVPLEPIVVTVPRLRRAEVRLTASGGALPGDFAAVAGLLARGAYDLEPWTTEIAFDEMLERGFDALRRQEQVKVLVDVAGTIG